MCHFFGPLPLILHCVHRAFQMVVVSLEVSKWWARRRPGGSRQMSSQSAVGCAMTSWWDGVGSHRSSHRKPVVYPHVLSIRKNDQKRKRSFDNILVFGQISRFLTRKKSDLCWRPILGPAKNVGNIPNSNGMSAMKSKTNPDYPPFQCMLIQACWYRWESDMWYPYFEKL